MNTRLLKNMGLAAGLAGLIAVVGGCKQKASLVGKWQNFDGQEEVEFRADGKFTQHSGFITSEGSYAIEPDGLVTFHFSDGIATMLSSLTRKISVSGDVLTMTTGEEKVIKYHRVHSE
jgi:hypothetical protein